MTLSIPPSRFLRSELVRRSLCEVNPKCRRFSYGQRRAQLPFVIQDIAMTDDHELEWAKMSKVVKL